MIFHQMSILQTRINFMEKARLKEEIFTGDDLQHFVLIKKNGKKSSSFYNTETLGDQSITIKLLITILNISS